jgi:hypothetical protein
MKDEITYLRADRDKQFAAKDQQIDTLQKLLQVKCNDDNEFLIVV